MSNLSIILLAIVVGSLGLGLLYASFRRKNGSNLPKNLEKMIAEGAEKAVARARSRYEIALDYRTESIQKVEIVLAKVHETYQAAPQLVDVNSMAFVFGAYIGETIRKNHPGCSWERTHDSYPLQWGEKTCVPMAWCTQRLTEGASENVWLKFQALQSGAEAPKSRSATAG